MMDKVPTYASARQNILLPMTSRDARLSRSHDETLRVRLENVSLGFQVRMERSSLTMESIFALVSDVQSSAKSKKDKEAYETAAELLKTVKFLVRSSIDCRALGSRLKA